mmetsp:Transcript_11431/g.13032  ORF Transcript_11431/g.13032 Transcript_11431/m.13032 type:complete len:520 (-) Transcript_11431:301-1860(-)
MHKDFKESLDYYKGTRQQPQDPNSSYQQPQYPPQQNYQYEQVQGQQYQYYYQHGQQQQHQVQQAAIGSEASQPQAQQQVPAAVALPQSQHQPPPQPLSQALSPPHAQQQQQHAYAEYYNHPAYAQQYAQYYQNATGAIAAYQTEDEKVVRKNQVPMKHDSNYNINTLLAKNIRESQYFKGLYEKTAFAQVVDEIYYKVDHVEPWMAAPANTPSTGFCLLYKLFTMKLTNKQMSALLEHRDSPYIRALGFLHLRYTCPPDQLWEWCEPYIEDEEEFKPGATVTKPMTIGSWLERLLSEQRYYGTLLPRIPKKIELDIQVKLLKKTNPQEVAAVVNTVRESEREFRIRKGVIVRARYSEDGKWYDARIEEPGGKPDTWWVTYLPEDEYGNQEEVSVKKIKQPTKNSQKTQKARDEELRRRILDRQRNSATTSDKRDYAKSISTFKTSISMPLSKRRRPDSPPPMDNRGAKTADEVLRKRGQLGHVEAINVYKDNKKQKHDDEKRSIGREKLLARYGNAASS